MKIIIVYDDNLEKSELISDIIGDKGFGDIVVRKKYIENDFKDKINNIYKDVVWIKIKNNSDYYELERNIDMYNTDKLRIMHLFSNYIISDSKQAALSLKKLYYIDQTYGIMNDNYSFGAMFVDITSYKTFLKNIITGEKAFELVKKIPEKFNIDGLVNIGEFSNFIRCITGDFDSRYFNSLIENEYTVVKRSSNKEKIKAEYEFYYLLPDDMKYWFVQPFEFVEEKEYASYRMERLYMTDLSIKLVHGSMNDEEFIELLEKYFYFFSCRHQKKCSNEEYRKISDSLYIDKVNQRIEKLRSINEFSTIENILEAANLNINTLKDKYFKLKEVIENLSVIDPVLVIGHGDPCFANAMYNKATKTLKFIDPKGATNENELWTDPYYDIAKLSHSICGRYDFFNNDLYEIYLDKDFSYKLEIPFQKKQYISIFKDMLERNGYDYYRVRIYEASLFLSMLPLHIDNPHKVLGFVINTNDILNELDQELNKGGK